MRLNPNTFNRSHVNPSFVHPLGSSLTLGAGIPPRNNMGGKSSLLPSSSSSVGPVEDLPDMSRHPDAAFVDQVSFTGKVADIPGVWFTDTEFVGLLNAWLVEIFGFGATADRGRGLNFYKSAYVLGDRWGFVCVGGQADTFLVQLTGQGAAAALAGWQLRLANFLRWLPSGRITRVDLAHDDYQGEHYTPQQCRQDYIDGKYKAGGRNPYGEPGGPWDSPDLGGLTYYIGKRKNGKLLRVYQKGRQLGGLDCERFPDWVRTELELHAKDRVIPIDALEKPGQYLAGAYPALSWVSEVCCRIATKSKALLLAFDRAKAIVRQQCGAYLYAFREVLGSADAVLDALVREKIPERLIMPDWSESPSPLPAMRAISLDEAWGYA